MRMTSHWLFRMCGVAVLTTGSAHLSADLVPVAPATGAGQTATARGTEDRPRAGLDAELVSEFKRRVDRYMRLHDKAQKQGTRQQQRDDIGENLVSQEAMAVRIRLAR